MPAPSASVIHAYGELAAAPARQPVDQLFRFVVRTDRDGNRALAKRARALGITPDALVQKHFETLFDDAPASPPSPSPSAASGPQKAAGRALLSSHRRRGEEERPPISAGQRAVLDLLRANAVRGGNVSLTHREIAERTGLKQTGVGAILNRLSLAGAIERVSAGKRGAQAIWRLTGRGG